MGRHTLCKTCRHPEVDTINQALLSGTPAWHLADEYRLSKGSLWRHGRAHIGELRGAHEAREAAKTTNLIDRMNQLARTVDQVLAKAKKADDPKVALAASREARAVIETLNKLRAGAPAEPAMPGREGKDDDLVAIKDVILGALGPFPDARQAVAVALLQRAQAAER